MPVVRCSLVFSLAAELCVHQPLHVQIVFVDLLIVFSFARPASLSRHQPFLLSSYKHVSLRDCSDRALDLTSLKVAVRAGHRATTLTMIIVRVTGSISIWVSVIRLVLGRWTTWVLLIVAWGSPTAIWSVYYGSAGGWLIYRLVVNIIAVVQFGGPLKDFFILIVGEVLTLLSFAIKVETLSHDWLVIHSSSINRCVVVNSPASCIFWDISSCTLSSHGRRIANFCLVWGLFAYGRKCIISVWRDASLIWMSSCFRITVIVFHRWYLGCPLAWSLLSIELWKIFLVLGEALLLAWTAEHSWWLVIVSITLDTGFSYI